MALANLSRRERQIMEILYSRGGTTAAEVHTAMEDAPSYSAVRALLRILEDKGHVRHEQDGPRYVFTPKLHRDKARRSAIRHMMETFFEGSPEQAVAALLDVSSSKLSQEELDRLALLIENARGESKR